MKRKYIRVYSLTLAAMLAIFVMAPAGAIAEKETVITEDTAGTANGKGNLFHEDFEDGAFDDSGLEVLPASGGKYEIVDYDGARGKVLKLQLGNTGENRLKTVMEKREGGEGETLMYSFSYLSTTASNYAYLRVCKEWPSNQQEMTDFDQQGWNGLETMFLKDNGDGRQKITHNTRFRGFEDANMGDFKEAEINQWHDVDIIFDWRHGGFYVFLDKQIVVQYDLDNQIWGIGVFDLHISSYPGQQYYIDNIAVTRIRTSADIDIPKENFPENNIDWPYRDLDIEFSSGTPGNAFSSGDRQVITMTAESLADRTAGNYMVTFSVEDEYGNIVSTKEEQLVLENGGSAELEVPLSVDKFGKYYLRAELRDKEGNAYRGFTEFSYFNEPAAGVQNKDYGTCLHMGHGREFDELADMVDGAGINVVRDEWWFSGLSDLEIEPGVYRLPEKLLAFWEELAQRDITLIYIHNLCDDYGEIAYHLAKTAREIGLDVIWEATNEWNIQGVDPAYYADKQLEAYEGFKRGDPDAFVCGGTMAGVDAPQMREALERLDGRKAFDAWSYHAYFGATIRPERSNLALWTQNCKDILAEYGYVDTPVFVTECGWSSADDGVTEQRKAQNAVRSAALAEKLDTLDLFVWYDFENDNVSTQNREYSWGMIRFFRPSFEHPQAHSAESAYLAMANYNALTNGGDYVGDLQQDDRLYLYRYNGASGKPLLMAGAIDDEPISVGIRLDCDKVTLYDIYGNAQECYTKDGVLSVVLDGDPLYIEGDFAEPAVCEADYALSGGVLEAPSGTAASLSLVKNTEAEATVSISSVKSVVSENEMVLQNGINKISFHTDNGFSGERKIILTVIEGRKPVFYAPVYLAHCPSASVSRMVMTSNSSLLGNWSARVYVRNNDKYNAVSGTLYFTGPDEITETIKPVQLPLISPAAEQYVVINLPQWLDADEAEGELVTDRGERIPLRIRLDYEGANYAQEKPVIDGVAEEGEWSKQFPMSFGTQALKANCYMMWDEENLYFLGELQEEMHIQMQTGEYIWQDDSIQLQLNTGTGQTTEVGFALTSQGPQVWAWYLETTEPAGKLLDDIDIAIQRQGLVTTYEVALPWERVVANTENIKKNGSFQFGLLVNNNDKGGREINSYAGDIAGWKTISSMSTMNLFQ